MRWLLMAAAISACSKPVAKHHIAPITPPPVEPPADLRGRLVRELRSGWLETYHGRDALVFERTPVQSSLKETVPVAVGVGSESVAIGPIGFPIRWPLVVPDKARVRSKNLKIHLSNDADVSAAWIEDEVSLRIRVCTKVAAIPLRVTSLLARDGDQWYRVFEHISFGRPLHASSDRARDRSRWRHRVGCTPCNGDAAISGTRDRRSP